MLMIQVHASGAAMADGEARRAGVTRGSRIAEKPLMHRVRDPVYTFGG